MLVDYGICQHHMRDHAGAEASFRRALALAPDDATILVNLGSVLVDREDYEAAEPALVRAVECDPQHAYAIALLAYCRARLCAWQSLATLHSQLLRRIDAGDDSINAFVALSLPLPAETQLRIARRWASDLSTAAVTPAARRTNTPTTNSKLRLGYVSSDFRTHALAFLLTEVWERHDRGRFETHAYSIGPRESSPLRIRIEAAFDHFVDCADETVEQTAQRIRADGIDLLIDLNGYTTHARSEIFALRPAPVQLHWLGYLGTLGAEHIDYIITDRFATPAEAATVLHRTLPLSSRLLLPERHPARHRDTRANPRGERSGRASVRVLLLQRCVQDRARNVRRLDAAAGSRCPAACCGCPLAATIASAPTCVARPRRRGIDPARLVFAPRVPLHAASRASCSRRSVPRYQAATTPAPPPTTRCSWVCRC